MITDTKRTGLGWHKCATCGGGKPNDDAVRVTYDKDPEVYVHTTHECYRPAVEGHEVDPFLAAMSGQAPRRK
jgi:hypothetical protein